MLGRRGVEVRNSFHALAKNYKQFWLQIYTSGSDTSVLASNIHLYRYVFYMVYVESGSTLWFLGLRNRKKRYQWYTFSKRFLFQCVTPGLSLRTIFSICRDKCNRLSGLLFIFLYLMWVSGLDAVELFKRFRSFLSNDNKTWKDLL